MEDQSFKKNSPLLVAILVVLCIVVGIQFYYIHAIDQKIEKQINVGDEKPYNYHRNRDQKHDQRHSESRSNKDMTSLFLNTYRYMLDQLVQIGNDETREDVGFSSVIPSDDEYQYSSFFGDSIDIKKNEKNLSLLIDLPDIDKNSLKVTCENGALSISGTSSSSKEEKDASGHVVRSMKRSGNFSKIFTLPEPVKSDSMKTSYKNGTLSISFELDNQ